MPCGAAEIVRYPVLLRVANEKISANALVDKMMRREGSM
jgi:hypothetical protein